MKYSTCCLAPILRPSWDMAICTTCDEPCYWVYRTEPKYEEIYKKLHKRRPKEKCQIKSL